MAVKETIGKGLTIREWEKSSGMNKRTFSRYLNLCYLSPKIVGDILEYNNPQNITLKQVMNLASEYMNFSRSRANVEGIKAIQIWQLEKKA